MQSATLSASLASALQFLRASDGKPRSGAVFCDIFAFAAFWRQFGTPSPLLSFPTLSQICCFDFSFFFFFCSACVVNVFSLWSLKRTPRLVPTPLQVETADVISFFLVQFAAVRVRRRKRKPER